MIGRLNGLLAAKNPPQILLDVGGVGYELDVPMSTFYHLPANGEKVLLHTQLVVREDGHYLYGFLTEDERGCFRQLTKVSGIGARTALAILSGLSVAELAQAVASQESGRLVKIPGIGKKTAERLLLELRDRLPKALGSLPTSDATSGTQASRDDILQALIALGYNEREVQPLIKQLPADTPVADGIRLALKQLAKP